MINLDLLDHNLKAADKCNECLGFVMWNAFGLKRHH